MWSEEEIQQRIDDFRSMCLEDLELLKHFAKVGLEEANENGILNRDKKDEDYGFNMLHLKALKDRIQNIDDAMGCISIYNTILHDD